MTDKSPERRIQELRTEIEHHNRRYYQEARPEITDTHFDALLRELSDLEVRHPEFLTADSPTQRVGGKPLEGFDTVVHLVPMMSLDNTYSTQELADWLQSLKKMLPDEPFSFVVEPKIDGVAFSLLYEDGLLVRAATRGNMIEGDNITANVRTIRSVPLRIPVKAARVEVRGEVFMPREGFLKLTEQQLENGQTPFKNPRNAAAGSLKQLNPRMTASRPLDAVLYGIGALEGMAFDTHAEMIGRFREWGLPVPPQLWICPTPDTVLEAIAELGQRRHDFPFDIDGAVVKVNERALYDTLGVTAKSPRWARAYKYAPVQAETVVSAITVQVGRTGVLTPVAELAPVLVSGSEIRRATLHNADEIARKDVRVGDHILVEKAGEVIPAVVEVLKAKRPAGTEPFCMPATCPACGGPVQRREGEVALRCENLQCPAQSVRWLLHAASRNALDIEAMGGVVSEKLVERGLAASLFDIFTLDLDQLATLNLGTAEAPRLFGEKNATKLLNAIAHAKTLPMDRWIHALGIPDVGRTLAIKVAKAHPSLDAVADSPLLREVLDLHALQEAAKTVNPRSRLHAPKDAAEAGSRREKLEAINTRVLEIADRLEPLGQLEKRDVKTGRDGMRQVQVLTVIKRDAASSIIDFFASERGKTALARMRELGIAPAPANPTTSDSLAGNTFALTGTLSAMTREEAAEAIRARGGECVSAVSGNTTYLVAGANTGARKMATANALNVAVLDESAFLRLLGRTPTAEPPHATPPATPEDKTGNNQACPQQLDLFS